MEPADLYNYSPAEPPDGRPETYRVTVVAPAADEVFELTSRYLETVWSEFLGPTTTLLARRIGLILTGPDPAPDLGVIETGNSVGVAPSKVRWSLTRLAQFELIAVSLRPAAVVTSGLVPAVPPHLVARLSPAGCAEHRQQLSPAAASRNSLLHVVCGGSCWLVKPESDRRLSDLVSVGLVTRVFPPDVVDEVIAGRAARAAPSVVAGAGWRTSRSGWRCTRRAPMRTCGC